VPRGRPVRVLHVVLNDFRNDSRVLKECTSLRAHGYEVLVAALHGPGLPSREEVSGFEVRRIALWSSRLPKGKVAGVCRRIELLLRIALGCRGNDVLHCHDLEALPIGVVMKLASLWSARLIYDAHEYESNQSPGQSERRTRALQAIERVLIRAVDHTITVSPSIAREYVRLYGVPEPAVVLNCPPLQDPVPASRFRERFGIAESQSIFLYQGRLTVGRGVEETVQAFEAMPDDSRVIVFMGYGPLDGFVQEAARRSTRIFWHPAVHPDELISFTASADVGLCLIEDSCLSYRYCLPNKLFEYIMAGIPVIASDLPEMRRVVKEEGVGALVADFRPDAIAGAIRACLRSDIEAGRRASGLARLKYCWERQESTLLGIYEGSLPGSKGRVSPCAE
jgi:glycosyltransferase involved in cell wall biosynthesis